MSYNTGPVQSRATLDAIANATPENILRGSDISETIKAKKSCARCAHLKVKCINHDNAVSCTRCLEDHHPCFLQNVLNTNRGPAHKITQGFAYNMDVSVKVMDEIIVYLLKKIGPNCARFFKTLQQPDKTVEVVDYNSLTLALDIEHKIQNWEPTSWLQEHREGPPPAARAYRIVNPLAANPVQINLPAPVNAAPSHHPAAAINLASDQPTPDNWSTLDFSAPNNAGRPQQFVLPMRQNNQPAVFNAAYYERPNFVNGLHYIQPAPINEVQYHQPAPVNEVQTNQPTPINDDNMAIRAHLDRFEEDLLGPPPASNANIPPLHPEYISSILGENIWTGAPLAATPAPSRQQTPFLAPQNSTSRIQKRRSSGTPQRRQNPTPPSSSQRTPSERSLDCLFDEGELADELDFSSSLAQIETDEPQEVAPSSGLLDQDSDILFPESGFDEALADM